MIRDPCFNFFNIIPVSKEPFSYDQGTIHAGKGCAEMRNFHIDALMVLKGDGINVRTHAHAEIAHIPTQYIIKSWKALGLCPCASQAQMMHLVGKSVISAQPWVLAIICNIKRSSTQNSCKSSNCYTVEPVYNDHP